MATPVIDLLPSPPVPTDAPATFATKAGAFVTAQAAMVPQLNAAFVWQAGVQATTLSYQTAAAASAGSADTSATAAAGQVVLAAAQVTLAANQVALAATQAGNAASSANQAQTAAAAAGAAAGLPSFTGKDAFDVLRINSGRTGVEWGKAGQSIGDVLVTARAPDSTYAQAGRISYLQSTYPDLYALIGSIYDTDRSLLTTSIVNSSYPSDLLGNPNNMANSGSLLILLTGNVAFCYTSSDNGTTWTRRPTPFSNGNQIAFLNGVFVATLQQNNNYVYTTTDGITWTQRFTTGAIASPIIRTVNNLFVMVSQGVGTFQTSPDGITWASRTGFITNSFVALLNLNNYLCVFTGSVGTLTYTADGITWVSVATNWAYTGPTATSGTLIIASAFYKNGLYYAVSTSADGAIYTSSALISGTWTKVPNALVNPDGSTFQTLFMVVTSPANEAILLANNTLTGGFVSNDQGATWTYRALTGFSANAYGLPGKFLSFTAANAIKIPYRSYDDTLNFITPKAPVQVAPLKTYIKGKLA